jgi:hypothetical protein
MPTVYNDDHSDWGPVDDARAYVMPVNQTSRKNPNCCFQRQSPGGGRTSIPS